MTLLKSSHSEAFPMYFSHSQTLNRYRIKTSVNRTNQVILVIPESIGVAGESGDSGSSVDSGKYGHNVEFGKSGESV